MRALNECGLATTKTPVYQGSASVVVGVEETWTINGFLTGASTSALSTALVTLEAAYGRNGQTIQLIDNDGSTVLRQMPGVHVLGGTEVISGPNYPEWQGAEYVNYRTYTIQVKGRYADSTPSSAQIIQWSEYIQFTGGGPLDTHVESQTGLPQKQRLKLFTTFRATQSGSAVGLLTWPNPALPLWPADEIIPQRTIKPTSPKRHDQSYTEFAIDWTYMFEAARVLVARPTYWR